jgi:PAS domain S-box-containing protein
MDASVSSSIEDASATYGIFDLTGRPYPVERLPFSRVVATGEAVTVDDLVIHRGDGTKVNIRAYAYPMWDDGTLTHVIVAFLDITAEVRAETDRRQTESRLMFAVDHAPIVIWSANRDGVVTVSNGAGLASMGVRSGELVGQNLFEIYKEHPAIPGYIHRALGGESFWYTAQIGNAFYDTWLTPMIDDAGRVTGVTGLSNDVSALRKLQASAIQNDRVIALGSLAASVAHEINNPLTYMLGHLVFLKESIDRLDGVASRLAETEREELRDLVGDMRESLDPVCAGTERIAGITRELRTFSKPTTETTTVDVQAAVTSVLKLVGKELESRASIELDLHRTSPVRGDTARLVQVVLNLVVNAMQALPPDRGTNQIWVSTADDGDSVVIDVSDNGPGIPPDDRERIFEPFQTSNIGTGSGLGLFVCRNIVSGWSGTVTVDDRPGGGARFRVRLPAARDLQAPQVTPARRRPRTPARARGHVMIVDDEAPVADVLRAQLEAAGYRVTLVSDADRALEHLAIGHEGIDLVYYDLMMREMSGMDFAAALAARAPLELARVVFMTGGAFTTPARDFRSLHAEQCVDKPFDILAETSRRIQKRRAHTSRGRAIG